MKLAEQYQRFASGSLPDLEPYRAGRFAFLGLRAGKSRRSDRPRTRAAVKNFRIAADLVAGEDLDGPTYQVLCKRAGIHRTSSNRSVAAGLFASSIHQPIVLFANTFGALCHRQLAFLPGARRALV